MAEAENTPTTCFNKPPRPPAVMPALRVRFNTPFGHLHVTLVVDVKTGRELEVFALLGRSGEMTAADIEGLCRLASLYLRAGGKLEDIARQLKDIGTNLSSKEERVSVPDSLGRAVAKAEAEMEVV